jgi:hypothetical protein
MVTEGKLVDTRNDILSVASTRPGDNTIHMTAVKIPNSGARAVWVLKGIGPVELPGISSLQCGLDVTVIHDNGILARAVQRWEAKGYSVVTVEDRPLQVRVRDAKGGAITIIPMSKSETIVVAKGFGGRCMAGSVEDLASGQNIGVATDATGIARCVVVLLPEVKAQIVHLEPLQISYEPVDDTSARHPIAKTLQVRPGVTKLFKGNVTGAFHLKNGKTGYYLKYTTTDDLSNLRIGQPVFLIGWRGIADSIRIMPDKEEFLNAPTTRAGK